MKKSLKKIFILILSVGYPGKKRDNITSANGGAKIDAAVLSIRETPTSAATASKKYTTSASDGSITTQHKEISKMQGKSPVLFVKDTESQAISVPGVHEQPTVVLASHSLVFPHASQLSSSSSVSTSSTADSGSRLSLLTSYRMLDVRTHSTLLCETFKNPPRKHCGCGNTLFADYERDLGVCLTCFDLDLVI